MFEDDSRVPDWIRQLSHEPRCRVHVCVGKNCTPNGSPDVYAAFAAAIDDVGLGDDVELIATSCRSRCELGPSVNVYPGPTTYGFMTAERAVRVVREHLLPGGKAIAELVVEPVAPASDATVLDRSRTRNQ